MASLLDKLKAARPLPTPSAPAPQREECDCLVRSQRFPIEDFPLQAIDCAQFSVQAAPGAAQLVDPEQILFLDTETTGLSGGVGTLAFLVGIGYFFGGEFIVEQYLMRDYDEEPFVLRRTLDKLRAYPVLATFNGRTFDVPLLQNRLILQRLQAAWPDTHVDLLPAARRIFKLRLQHCSLSALEAKVFGRPRQDDLPGAQVPERFFQYLKTKQLALLDDVLDHNCLDIVSLARLMFALWRLHDAPLSAAYQEDLFSLGRLFDRQGQAEKAAVCYRACCQQGVQTLAQLRLADLYRRMQRHQEAAQIWEGMMEGSRGGAAVYIALAKLYEHRFHQPRRALAIARKGMLYCLEQPSVCRQDELADLQKRIRRLLEKAGESGRGII